MNAQYSLVDARRLGVEGTITVDALGFLALLTIAKQFGDGYDRVKAFAETGLPGNTIQRRVNDALEVPNSLFTLLEYRPGDDCTYAIRLPSLKEPSRAGEYWLNTASGFLQLIYTPSSPNSDYMVYDPTVPQHESCATWEEVIETFRPISLLSAKEYYTRKIKGER